jgi:hypothetical protein
MTLTSWSGKSGMSPVEPGDVTNDDGEFVFRNLRPDGRYSWSAQAPGYGVAQGKMPPLRAGKEATVDPVKLVRADRPIAGRVVDKSGKPVVGIEVSINSSNGQQTQKTDAEGRFRFDVVPDDRPLIYLRLEYGKLGHAKEVHAGDEEVELTPGPALDAE